MSGGKSSSSSTTDQSATTLSADGLVTGKVFNVAESANVDYTEQFPQSVADIMGQLIEAATGAGMLAADAYENSLEATTSYAVTAKQPDLDLVKSQSKQNPIIIIGSIAVVGLIIYLIARK